MDEHFKKRLSLIVKTEDSTNEKSNSTNPDISNRTPSALFRRSQTDPKQKRSALAELFLNLEDKIEEEVEKAWTE